MNFHCSRRHVSSVAVRICTIVASAIQCLDAFWYDHYERRPNKDAHSNCCYQS